MLGGVDFFHQLKLSAEAHRRRAGIQLPVRRSARRDFHRHGSAAGQVLAQHHRVQGGGQVVDVGEVEVSHPSGVQLAGDARGDEGAEDISMSSRCQGGRPVGFTEERAIRSKARQAALLEDVHRDGGRLRGQRGPNGLVREVGRHEGHRNRTARAGAGVCNVLKLEIQKRLAVDHRHQRFDGTAEAGTGPARHHQGSHLACAERRLPLRGRPGALRAVDPRKGPHVLRQRRLEGLRSRRRREFAGAVAPDKFLEKACFVRDGHG